ncbi:MAG: hypothetical protein A2X67_10125 [Ignavibacteria bacterium GWA2_55_11]|nr:MAG: hypothetical protein A2X67_10125 [Ignavibacteria bacterium GWA2_55_11]OGU63244.1 MAG: hypothetical protein A3C56_10295 [Ignavibacteria bacterium RIFCSPHIGHO2_02_FULL_56_12]OGU70959.1 MAG: hypothetical protein A3H45_12460 [Ignavibacteria bacterium RIFCSPLOWO2_02_FULL_55_14]OGU76567.1 MAG: hypothetical protein A3G43_04590 [Ignavibacteria bacterium RIFCSPLOWO2_12_FULL_56_21]
MFVMSPSAGIEAMRSGISQAKSVSTLLLDDLLLSPSDLAQSFFLPLSFLKKAAKRSLAWRGHHVEIFIRRQPQIFETFAID